MAIDEVTTTPVTGTSGFPPALPAAGESTKPSLRVRANEVRFRLEEEVRADPVKTLAIALAAGFVIGKIIHFALGRAKAGARERTERRDWDVDEYA